MQHLLLLLTAVLLRSQAFSDVTNCPCSNDSRRFGMSYYLHFRVLSIIRRIYSLFLCLQLENKVSKVLSKRPEPLIHWQSFTP